MIKGDLIILYIYDATAWLPIACLTKNSLALTRSVIETQTKCEPGVTEATAGTLKYTVPFEGKYIDTTSTSGDGTKASHDKLFLIMNNTASVEWKMDTGLADTDAYYGVGIITDLNMDAGTGDELVDFSGTLTGDGKITTTDPHA
jgi:hypothetical protein